MASYRVHPVVKLDRVARPRVPLNVRQHQMIKKYFPQGSAEDIIEYIGKKNIGIPNMAKRKYTKGKKKRGGRIKKRIPRALAPRTKVVRVKATDYRNLAGTGTIAVNYGQLNSVDDCFIGGSGQPLGYDQWKALYKKALVIGSKIIIKFHNRGTSACMVGIWPATLNQGQTTLTDYEYYMETAGCKSRLLSPEMDHTVVFHKASTKRHLKRKDIRDDDRLYLDLITETPPTDLAYWHYWAQAVDQSSAYAVDAVVTIEYIVLLTDPIIPARSVET